MNQLAVLAAPAILVYFVHSTHKPIQIKTPIHLDSYFEFEHAAVD